MSTLKPVKIKINYEKEKVVNHATLAAESFSIACIWVDLAQKEAEIVASSDDDGLPGIAISHGDQALIEIQFPEYQGWEVFAHTIGKYTLSVCLTKKKVEKKKPSIKVTNLDPMPRWPFPTGPKPVIQ